LSFVFVREDESKKFSEEMKDKSEERRENK
jgi:hypothetical protein